MFGPLLSKPREAENVAAWFERIAATILNGAELLVAGEPYRFAEIEFYYHADGHADPFTHCDPIQNTSGQWYLHRTGTGYRSGSFKGIDLTFGEGSFGGILIRSVVAPDGSIVNGPSLCVDRLIAKTGVESVAQLDETIGVRDAWDPGQMQLKPAEPTDRPIHQTARVGLSLKRAQTLVDPERYVLKPYRYLTEPRKIAKGKPHLVLALHAENTPIDEIHRQTGSPRKSIGRYIDDFNTGTAESDFAPYHGTDLSTRDLCRLHGLWHTKYGH